MSDAEVSLVDAISRRDVSQVRSLILAAEFFVISVADDESDEELAAMTAEIGDFEVLVAFTSEKSAGHFVHQRSELFGEEESVDGVMINGALLLEYLPKGLGLLLDPESDGATMIDPSLADEVAKG
jgi:hypothetical protein